MNAGINKMLCSLGRYFRQNKHEVRMAVTENTAPLQSVISSSTASDSEAISTHDEVGVEFAAAVKVLSEKYSELTEFCKIHLSVDQQHALSQAALILAARLSFVSLARRTRIFGDAEKFGVHFMPVHFYSPVPSRAEIDERVYSTRYDNIPGLNLDVNAHRAWLHKLSHYGDELSDIPAEPTGDPLQFSWNNPAFGPGDAVVYYSMIRHLRPKRVIEIGSGYSTLLAARALEKNGAGELICIEPYPMERLRLLESSHQLRLIPSMLQDVDTAVFEQLGENDILFIDSTHVSKIGSDVNHEIFSVLPRLKSGVYCHIHDMFFPWDYPQRWVEELNIFWNEQYVVMAFLAFNNEFRLEVANQFLGRDLSEEFLKSFPIISGRDTGGGSLWIKRT